MTNCNLESDSFDPKEEEARRKSGSAVFSGPSSIFCRHYGVTLYLLPREDLLEPVYRLASEPGISIHMEWARHRGISDTEDFFAYCGNEARTGSGYHFAVESNSTIVGIISLTAIERRLRRAEITTWLGNSARGQGLNYKVKHILMEYSVSTMHIRKFVFRVSAGNTSSLRSHVRLGTRHEGILRGEMLTVEGFHDIHYLSLLDEEFLAKYARLDLEAVP